MKPSSTATITSSNQQQEMLIRTFGALHAYDDEENLFVISPDRLGFGVIGDPMSGFDPQAMDGLNALLNLHWPTGALVQFTLYKSPDIEETLYDYQQMRKGLDTPLLKQMCDARVDFMRELTRRPIGQVAGADVRYVR